MARKVRALHALTNLDRRTTINVGLVNGGQSINIGVENASWNIVIRYKNIAEREDIFE